jgi:hypothetical protein
MERDAQNSEPRNGESGKRHYEPPEILSQEVFETTALTCRKVGGTGGQCNAFSKS